MIKLEIKLFFGKLKVFLWQFHRLTRKLTLTFDTVLRKTVTQKQYSPNGFSENNLEMQTLKVLIKKNNVGVYIVIQIKLTYPLCIKHLNCNICQVRAIARIHILEVMNQRRSTHRFDWSQSPSTWRKMNLHGLDVPIVEVIGTAHVFLVPNRLSFSRDH